MKAKYSNSFRNSGLPLRKLPAARNAAQGRHSAADIRPAVAQRQAVRGGARGQHLDLHLGHVDINSTFMPVGQAMLADLLECFAPAKVRRLNGLERYERAALVSRGGRIAFPNQRIVEQWPLSFVLEICVLPHDALQSSRPPGSSDCVGSTISTGLRQCADLRPGPRVSSS
ncbi:hypothetical protein I6F33_24675 [Bradyrhizobium sp. BRP20]|uniref:hypothetical protein n=1 Tax=Bradyrhizobium sp. BRP20 TaxID=2793822 RepID=UPI001CD54B5E|nr:hypothetical protein [Bradyrhizobium sp. BRP20]MCA1436161.1 hypothetical protein [Bradyrhizobium sp. BRP20]